MNIFQNLDIALASGIIVGSTTYIFNSTLDKKGILIGSLLGGSLCYLLTIGFFS
jgi:hypothetical protein